MQPLAPERIRHRSQQAGRSSAPLHLTQIDFSRPFVHEHATQLYHTPYYAQLSREQRLRYNQLYGIRSNEQFMMFEQGFTNQVMAKLAQHPMLRDRAALRDCLALMLVEENRHRAMFYALNKACLPEVYNRQPIYFTRLYALERAALWLMTRIPQHLLFLLWLVLLLEEHSTRVSIEMLQTQTTESLGELEPNMVRVHQAHLKDEARHVQIDAHLLQLLLDRASVIKRRSNARLFRRLLSEILQPKRSGVRVIEHLVREYPELAPHKRGMIAALRSQGVDPYIRSQLNDVQALPITAALLQSYPEFNFSAELMS